MINVNFNTHEVDAQDVNFFPGSDWLFYKISANQNSFDLIVLEMIDIIQTIDDQASTFYVRYYDEENLDHLRFRILVSDIDCMNMWMKAFNDYFLSKSYIRKVSIDTYQREIVRYGWPTIKEVERLFCNDSMMIQKLLKDQVLFNDVEKMKFCVSGIYNYLRCFEFSQKDMKTFIDRTKSGFFREFHMDRTSKKSINKAYSNYFRNDLKLDLYTDRIEGYLVERKHICEEILKKYQVDSRNYDLIWSIIHMFANKIFNKQYRLYEMIAYDILNKIILTRTLCYVN